MAEKGSEGEGRNTIQILSSNMCENLNQEITLHFLGKKNVFIKNHESENKKSSKS